MYTNLLSRSLHIINLVFTIVMFVGWTNSSAFSSGRTDRLKGAPFIKIYDKKTDLQSKSVGFVAVRFDENMNTKSFYADRRHALQPVADAMTAYLGSLGWFIALPDSSLSEKGSPYVYVGSSEGETAPPAAATMREEYEKYPPMIIYVQKPSAAWKSKLQQAMTQKEADLIMILWIGFSEYPKSDKGVFGKKVVLGTGYERGIRFLSAEDKPVEVLQVSGMLLDKSGNILRAGAEGLFHADTPFWAQVVELKKEMNDQTIRKILEEERRDDLPGQPLVWEVALNNLVAQLYPHKRAAVPIGLSVK